METFIFQGASATEAHFNFLCKSLIELRKEQSTCDVLIKAKEREVYAHRVVLVTFSSYFRSTLYGDFSESNVNKTSVVATVDLSEFDSDCVELMVMFMYSGEAKIPSVIEKAIDLFEVVNYCQVQKFQDILSDCFINHFLRNNPFMCFSAGLLYAENNLKEKSEMFIKLNLTHSLDITETEDFLNISHQGLKSLLPKINESLPIDELTIFNLVMKWVLYDEKVRIKMLGSILPLIRFSLINRHDVRENILDCEIFKSSKGLREMIISEFKRQCWLGNM